MEKLEKSIKKRYLLFVSSIIIITLTALFIVQNSISSQILDSNLISLAGKQRVLGQRISKLAFSIGYAEKQETDITLNTLKELTKQWDSLQGYQQAINNKKENNETVTVLLEKNKYYLNELTTSGKNLIGQSDFEVLKAEFKNIAEVEKPYFENIDSLISEYQKEGEKNLKTLKTVIYFLAIGTFLLLLGGFLMVIRPVFKKFLFNLKEIKSSNDKLETSRTEIKSNLSELTKLKTDLELKDANNRIFIEQAPTAIAMLDTNMCYLAASKKWISDYKMEDQDIVGRCHYDLFPEIGDDWKANHQKCLNGAIDVCDEAPFVRLDGTVQWIFWDVRPWYISEGEVGGLIMHTGDITHIKEKEDEKERIENILDKTSQIARIGTWEIDLIKNNVFWSKVLHEIHEVPEDYEPNLESAIEFFKEGISRNAIEKAINDSKEQGTPFDLELELITAKGKAIWTRAIGQAEFIRGECTRVFGVFQDINKIKSAELALHKAHTELKAIFNSKALAIVSTDNEGLITHFNRGAEDFLGYSAAEMIGRAQPNVFYLEEELVNFRRDMANKYEREFENYDPYRDLGKEDTFDIREWTFVRKDGTTFPVESTLTTIKDEQGNNVGFLGVSTDISGRKIAEKELIRKNQLLNYAEKITLMGNWRWDVLRNTVWLSDGMYEIYEIDDKEGVISFDNLVHFVHPEDKENVEEHAKATIENKVFENDFISRIVTAKGETKILRLLGEVKTNNLGEVIEVIGTTQDITEQKIAETELLLKNKFLSFAERITKMGNWQWNLVTGALQWSDNMHEIYASDKNQIDLSYETFISFVHPEDKAMVAKFVADALVEKKLPNNFVHRIITSDGELKTIHTLGEVIFDNHGEILEMIGTTQDITEQKMAEAELLRKNHFLSFAERITKMGNWQWCVITDSLKWSSNLYGIFEHDLEDVNLTYDTFFSYVHPDDKEYISSYIKEAFAEKKFPDNFIHRIVTSRGKIKTVHFLGEVILDDQGEILEMIGTCQDVTEQKMEENKFRGLLESAPDAMVITNEQGNIQLINKQAEKLFGYNIEELLGKSVEILIPKRFLGTHEGHRAEFFNEPHTRSIGEGKELYGIDKSGKEIPIQISLSPLETEQGVLVSAAIRDITAQKLAKNELLRKNQLLNFAEEITLMGHWIWNIPEDKVEWSSNLYNIFELNEEKTDLRFNTYFSFVHPDDEDLVSAHFDNAAIDKGFTSFSHRIITNGKVKTVQLLGEVVKNTAGDIIEMIGTCQDITEQKMAENKFRGLLESAPDAMVITDEASKIQMINKQAEKMFGYKIEELFNKSVDLLLPKRFLSGCESKVDKLLGDLVGTESSGEEDLAAMNKDGKEFPVQITLSPLETEDGILVSAAIRDITEQKIAEAELLRKNQLLTFAEKITMMGNWQWNLITNEVKWSTNLFEIFGIDKDTELAYDTYFNSVHNDEKELVSKHVEQAIEDKEFMDLTHRIWLPDGSVKTIQLLAEVVLDAKGEVVEMTGTCQDVTAQKMAENKFRGLLESAPDAMVITNEDSLIQIINKQAELLFGYTIDEIYNKPIDLLLPIRSLEDHEFQRKSFLNKPKTTELSEGRDMFAINKNGREFPIQMSLSPLKTEEGMLISAVIRDVTEQKSAQNKIIKSKNDLEILAQKLIKNNNQLADFAHITSHNLRAPVSNLNSLLGLYNASVSEDDKAFLFEKFEKVINHLTVTLNTLVDAVKIKNNTPKEFEKLKFNDVLNKTKEILTGQIMKNEAIITSDFSEISKIKYDRIYLESIFLNLVGNSIKYRSKNRVPEIFIKSEIIDGKVRLFFQDNGLGIDLEKHGHKLFGLNKVFHRHPEAKGVGLFMVKTQVEALNGTIYATSKVNEGTTFYINFN